MFVGTAEATCKRDGLQCGSWRVGPSAFRVIAPRTGPNTKGKFYGTVSAGPDRPDST
jgi:hypothetical protein